MDEFEDWEEPQLTRNEQLEKGSAMNTKDFELPD
jgi:hypothetical protein